MGMLAKSFWSLVLVLGVQSVAQAFDHSHNLWNDILTKNVVLEKGGQASKLRYSKVDKAKLKKYTSSLLAVPKPTFKGWNKNQQLAFYFNLYNALTVQLILDKYPVTSIQKIGSSMPWGTSTWEIEFFKLFGVKSNLDWIEHKLVRRSGLYKEPRVHFAFNCASIGCPALTQKAFVAEKLDQQLESALVLFLKDKSRNSYEKGSLQVSKIFSWYEEDFTKGWKGYKSLKGFFAKYAEHLSSNPAEQKQIRDSKASIKFRPYNWKLNEIK